LTEKSRPHAPVPDWLEASLIRHYSAQPRAVDALPYTAEFNELCHRVWADQPASDPTPRTHHAIHQALLELRKARLRKARPLPLKGRTTRVRVPLSDVDRGRIVALYRGLGRGRLPADHLPYTDQFEALFARFHAEAGVRLSRALFFCAVMGLRKQGKLRRFAGSRSSARPRPGGPPSC
jgi:hypothetical protein